MSASEVCTLASTRVNALGRVKDRAFLDFFQRRRASMLADARSVSAEYVFQVLKFGVDARQRELTLVDERSLNGPYKLA
jgi:hypothetical protein